MKENTKNLIRWIFVLPGSLIAGFLWTFPLHWFLYLAYAHNGIFLGFIELPDGANVSIEHAIYPAIITLGFILTGYKIAPKYKFKTAVILSILYILLIVFFLIFLKNNYLNFHLEIRSIGPIVGLAIGLFICWKKEK